MAEKTMIQEMKDDMMGDVFDLIGPELHKKLGKFIGPAVKEFEKEMLGCRFQLMKDPETGYMFFMIIEEETIQAFPLTKEPKLVVPIKDATEFVEKLLKGELFKSLQG